MPATAVGYQGGAYYLLRALKLFKSTFLWGKVPCSFLRTTHRDVLQVQVLVVHGRTQLPDFLLFLLHLLLRELILVSQVILVQLQQLDHQLQAGPVQVHVETVPTQDVHEGGRAQSQVLREWESVSGRPLLGGVQ